MGDVINLRKARKRAERQQHVKEAAENRILHGRSKAERQLEEAQREQGARKLEAHRLNDEDAG